MELRPYQNEAVDRLYQWFTDNHGNPLVVMPTGTGKSLTIAEFIRRAVTEYPETRVVMLTHVKELIEQNFAALIRQYPSANAGIYSASVGRKDIRAQILIAGIQSLYKHAYKVQKCDILIVDEAHLMPRKAETMYGHFLKEIREINPNVKLVGFTATAFRLDSGHLAGDGEEMFQGVAFEYGMADAIQQGYLSVLVSKSTDTHFDVSGVKKRLGDFVESELEAVYNTSEKNRDVIDEIMRNAASRRACLVFATGVDHATALRDLIRARGRSAEVITGKTPKGERARIIADYKAGRIWALVNVNVLTTGFDAPAVDLVALVRATMSPVLYIQMCGRGARLAEGKDDCLILDFAQNIERHGPVDKPRIRTPGEGGGGEAPMKVCDACQMYNYTSARRCSTCGAEFPPPEPKFKGVASTEAVLSFQQQTQWIEVATVSYDHHHKIGGTTSMRVTYGTAKGDHREWVCVEHGGPAGEKARLWWMKRSMLAPPETVDEAVGRSSELRKPTHITVQKDGRYSTVKKYRFDGDL